MSIETDFWQFHAENPHVYTRLVEMARQLRVRGHQKIGIGMLFEVLRWEHYFTTTDPSNFKLNNNYRSRYARMIMGNCPDLDGMFEIRALQAEEDEDVISRPRPGIVRVRVKPPVDDDNDGPPFG